MLFAPDRNGLNWLRGQLCRAETTTRTVDCMTDKPTPDVPTADCHNGFPMAIHVEYIAKQASAGSKQAFRPEHCEPIDAREFELVVSIANVLGVRHAIVKQLRRRGTNRLHGNHRDRGRLCGMVEMLSSDDPRDIRYPLTQLD